MKIENQEKLNKVIIMDVGHVKQVLNDDEKFILEKYSLYREYLNNEEVTFEFALKYIDAIMKQAEKDSVGLMYLIVGYGSSGFGGIIKKSLIKILEKGVYKKLIRKWLTVSNHDTYVDALNNVNTKHGIIKLYTRFSCEDDQKLCYFMNDDKAELAFLNTDKVYAYPKTFILPEKVKFEDKYCELTKINKNVFFGEYISSIFIPKSVIDIDDYAFFSCRIVKSFLFESESNLKRIGDTAFGVIIKTFL
ncbi:MAG: leucine-rich repeat protein [Bacilli bacterium]|nr:leucine-rich repeat protein [Bacilli bacterium]